jgi:hypothetical protein
MAKTGNFYPPIVEDPPEFVVKQDASIIKDTGISSREHHAKIRRAVEAVTRACRDSGATRSTMINQG